MHAIGLRPMSPPPILWISREQSSARTLFPTSLVWSEGSFVRLLGTLKQINNKRHFTAPHIRLASPKELLFHKAEVMYAWCELTLGVRPSTRIHYHISESWDSRRPTKRVAQGLSKLSKRTGPPRIRLQGARFNKSKMRTMRTCPRSSALSSSASKQPLHEMRASTWKCSLNRCRRNKARMRIRSSACSFLTWWCEYADIWLFSAPLWTG